MRTTKSIENEIKELEVRKSQLLKLGGLRAEVASLEIGFCSEGDSQLYLKAIIITVSQATRLSVERIMSGCRTEEIAFARFTIFSLARELTPLSLESIAKIFRKDHGSVMHGCRACKDRRSVDAAFAARYDELFAASAQKFQEMIKTMESESKGQITR
jgi:chromosomal replication initiation ATPase DnaA